jgi:hypothetical protein
VQADGAIEGDHPEENIDRAGPNEVVEDVHVAETTMRSGNMWARSSGKDQHGCGEHLLGCGQENSGELISRRGLAGKRPTFIGWECS